MPREAVSHWITAREVASRFRISRTTVWAWVAKGLLPQPHHLRNRAVWRSADIEAAETRLIAPPSPPEAA